MEPNQSDIYSDLPSPDELALEAESAPRKIPLRDYSRAMEVMRAKGYSFAEIADWISKKLGEEVTRSQVSYVLSTPAVIQDKDDEDERTEAMLDAAEEEGRA